MAFNPQLVVAHEVNKAFQNAPALPTYTKTTKDFPRWYDYYNLEGDTIGAGYISYKQAVDYRYGNNAIFAVIAADSSTIGYVKLTLDTTEETATLSNVAIADVIA